jgi:hypothetical protein
MDYIIENGDYGKRLKLTSAWNDEFYKIIQQDDIIELILNSAWGWKPDNLYYLRLLRNTLAV